MAGPEATIERWVVKHARSDYGVESVKLSIGGGYPDRMFLIPGGRPLMHEYKRLGGRPDPRQIEVHAKLKKLGYDVQVHDDRDVALAAVVEAVRRAKRLAAELHEAGMGVRDATT